MLNMLDMLLRALGLVRKSVVKQCMLQVRRDDSIFVVTPMEILVNLLSATLASERNTLFPSDVQRHLTAWCSDAQISKIVDDLCELGAIERDLVEDGFQGSYGVIRILNLRVAEQLARQIKEDLITAM